jgi:cell division control protein 45
MERERSEKATRLARKDGVCQSSIMLADLLTIRYSLQQCQQNYSHMDISLKKELPSKLEAIAPEYGLIELSYPSFTRAFGFQLAQLSAADAVEGLSALLEAAMGVRLEVEKEGGRNGGEWFGGTRMWNLGGGLPSIKSGGGDKENVDPRGANGEVEGTQEKKKEQSWHVQNFWTAYDAIEE